MPPVARRAGSNPDGKGAVNYALPVLRRRSYLTAALKSIIHLTGKKNTERSVRKEDGTDGAFGSDSFGIER
jgi:hypothetical protein